MKAGADIDHQDDEGTTLLMFASRCGYVDVVNWCISQGADINLQDNEGKSALHHAAETFSAEGVADFLIQAGANLEIRDQRGYSPLDLAAKEGSVEVARLLIQAGSDYNAYGKHGRTPLHIAAQTGAVEIVSLLIQAGADCNARSRLNSNSRLLSLIRSRQTPLHAACDRSLNEEIYEWSQTEEQRVCQVVAQLISGGADIDARDRRQRTPLHLAASSSLTSVAMFLIESGADFALFTSSGLGPLDIAVQEELDDLVDYIISKQDDADRKEELRRRKPSNTLDDSW